MIIPFSNNSTRDEELAIIYDIGSASIGGALVRLRRNNKPEIIYTNRQEVSFQEKLDPDQLLNAVRKALRQTGKKIRNEGLKRVDNSKIGGHSVTQVYCTLSSPWYISHTNTFTREHEEPVEIDDEYVHDLMKSADEEFGMKQLSEYAQTFSEDLSQLEQHIIKISLNGYSVNNPYGKYARQVEASVFYSLVPKQIIKTMHETITEEFNTEHFHYHSFTLASFSVMRNVLADLHLSNYLFMDISGELTDISLIKDDRLVTTVSFPIGKHFMLRAIAGALNTDPHEATTRIRMLQKGELHEDEEERITDLLSEVGGRWLKTFRESLEKISDEAMIPDRVFFVSDKDIGPVFEGVLEHAKGDNGMLQEGYTEIEFLTPSRFEKHYDKRKGVKNDVFLAIETLFANTVASPFQQEDT